MPCLPWGHCTPGLWPWVRGQHYMQHTSWEVTCKLMRIQLLFVCATVKGHPVGYRAMGLNNHQLLLPETGLS